MGDLKNPKLIIAKGMMFLLLGALATGLIMLQGANLRLLILHGIAVWAFCRFYYFAFYVIEHYVDREYRFAGLGSFIVYVVTYGRRRDRSSMSFNSRFRE